MRLWCPLWYLACLLSLNTPYLFYLQVTTLVSVHLDTMGGVFKETVTVSRTPSKFYHQMYITLSKTIDPK